MVPASKAGAFVTACTLATVPAWSWATGGGQQPDHRGLRYTPGIGLEWAPTWAQGSAAGAPVRWHLAGSWRMHGSLGLVGPPLRCNGFNGALHHACAPLEQATSQSTREYALNLVFSRLKHVVGWRNDGAVRNDRADAEDDGRWRLSVNRRRVSVRYEIRF